MIRLALALLLVLSLSGCHGATRAAAVRYAEILRLDADDPTLPAEAREIARDAADAFEVQAWRLGGDAPSAEVLARIEGTAPVSSESSK